MTCLCRGSYKAPHCPEHGKKAREAENALPPFLRRVERTKNLTPSHRRSVKQEKELAKRVGGQRTPASGAGSIKGDVRKKGVLRIEAKTTKNASFSVSLEMIRKIEEAAATAAELPVIIVEFNDGNGRKLKEIAICPTYVIDQLTEE